MKARILILCLVLLTACQQVERDYDYKNTTVEGNRSSDSACLTVKAIKMIDTKALDLINVNDKDRLNAYWKSTETVNVFRNGTHIGALTVVPAAGDKPRIATLTGTLEVSGLKEGNVLTLLIPGRADEKWDYTGQNGVLTGESSIEDSFDYATATVTIDKIVGTTVTTTADAQFENQQSIYRLDFKVNSSLKSVKWFSVSSSQNKLVTSRIYDNGWGSAYGGVSVSLASSSYSPYLSLRNENTTEADTYSFMVRDYNNKLYSGTKVIPAEKLGNGQFLSPRVDLSAYSIATQASGNISNPQDIF
jgi:hypothetical protein